MKARSWAIIISIMDQYFDYRENLVKVTALLKRAIERMCVFGFNLELVNDLNNGLLSFEDGEEASLDPVLLERSDDPAVQKLYACTVETERCLEWLWNVNCISDDETEEYIEEVWDEFPAGVPSHEVWLEETATFLAYHYGLLLQACYRLAHRIEDTPFETVSEVIASVTIQDLEKYTTDSNISRLIELSSVITYTSDDLWKIHDELYMSKKNRHDPFNDKK